MTQMAGRCLYCVVWALMTACRTSSGFNVDMSTASLRHGEPGSMFGFTIAQHVDRGQNWSVNIVPFLLVERRCSCKICLSVYMSFRTITQKD